LPTHSILSSAFLPHGTLRRHTLILTATLCLLASSGAAAQRAVGPALQPPPQSELAVEGMASYGNYRIFASGTDCKLYTSGLEYDRNSWGYFLTARMDYVAELLPLVLLSEPAKADIWGNPESTARQLVPGIGISPIGLRMVWRSKHALKPYLTVKGGVIAFDKKVLSMEATYLNFSLQSGVGVQVRLNQRFDLRLGLFNDFHFSNAFMVPVNPGLDVMNANLALSYHLGHLENR
jgi:Lipid A 3-O-deacylase (PagL)